MFSALHPACSIVLDLNFIHWSPMTGLRATVGRKPTCFIIKFIADAGHPTTTDFLLVTQSIPSHSHGSERRPSKFKRRHHENENPTLLMRGKASSKKNTRKRKGAKHPQRRRRRRELNTSASVKHTYMNIHSHLI